MRGWSMRSPTCIGVWPTSITRHSLPLNRRPMRRGRFPTPPSTPAIAPWRNGLRTRR
jgi:hypothetical protein